MKNKKAFTLVEVMVALAIITVGVLPIMSMYPSALKMSAQATTNEEWSRVTASIVDYIKAKEYDGLKALTWSNSGTTKFFDGKYNFEKVGSNFTSNNFKTAFFSGANVFFINTKGIKLDDYQFSIYMEQIQPKAADGASTLYNKYQLKNNSIVSASTTSSIIYGIIKIREKNAPASEWDKELQKDMKFIITPIENWGG